MNEDSKWSEVVNFLLTCEEHFPSNSDRNGNPRNNRNLRDNRNPKDNRNPRGTRTGGYSGNNASPLKKLARFQIMRSMNRATASTTPNQASSKVLH